MLLTNSAVMAILPAVDMARAKDFYTNKLGLKLSAMSMEDPLVFDAGAGTSLVVYHKPEGTKAEHTVAGFMVNDLTTTMTELRANGVVFEEYDLPNLKTVSAVVDYGKVKSAWFKDTEGNILALNQMA